MFFGAVLTPGVECTPDCSNGEILHISQACLYNPVSSERTYIHVTDGEKSYALCALQKDKQENASLDLFVSTRAGTTFKITGGKNEVHLIGYFEPDAETDSEDMSECSHEDDEDLSMDGDDTKDGDDDEDDEERSTEEDGDASDSDDDEDEEVDSEDELDDIEGDDSDDEDDDCASPAPAAPAKKVPEKADKKQQSKTDEKAKAAAASVAESKKRKADAPVQKPQKVQKTEASANSAESDFEKSIVDYLKKNGRCMIAQLAGKVRKPDALKAVKYQVFLKSKPCFTIEGQYVSLKA